MRRFRCASVRAVLAAVCLVPLLASRAPAEEDQARMRDVVRKYFRDFNGLDLAKLVGFEQPVRKVIALEYKVLLAAYDEKGNLSEKPVDPKTHTFKLGDRFRITIQPFAPYHVYVFTKGASGESRFLLPDETEEPPVAKPDEAIPLPSDGYFEFAPPAGEEMMMVVATEKPVADLDLFKQVLSQDPSEDDTPEEKQLRQSLKATRKKVLKSVEESRKEILDKTVMWRGIVTKPARDRLAKDIRARGVKEGTFEEPTREGISAIYATTDPGGQARLLVHIPLKSGEGQSE